MFSASNLVLSHSSMVMAFLQPKKHLSQSRWHPIRILIYTPRGKIGIKVTLSFLCCTAFVNHNSTADGAHSVAGIYKICAIFLFYYRRASVHGTVLQYYDPAHCCLIELTWNYPKYDTAQYYCIQTWHQSLIWATCTPPTDLFPGHKWSRCKQCGPCGIPAAKNCRSHGINDHAIVQ